MTYRPTLTAGVFALFVFASTASASTLELGLAIDGSGSIGSSDFDLQIQGYQDAFSDPNFFSSTVGGSVFDNIAVGVYQFASGVTEEIAFTEINNQSDADWLANEIGLITQTGGLTNFVDSVNTISSDMLTNGIASERQVIDYSTDGVPTFGGGPLASIAAADAARAGGIDAINALGVGSGVNVGFLEGFSDADNLDPGDNSGFVQTVDSFDAFGPAIEAKLEREIQTQPIPEPEVGLVAALALAGFVVYRRRQQKGSLAAA
jgi:hypothetical protein